MSHILLLRKKAVISYPPTAPLKTKKAVEFISAHGLLHLIIFLIYSTHHRQTGIIIPKIPINSA